MPNFNEPAAAAEAVIKLLPVNTKKINVPAGALLLIIAAAAAVRIPNSAGISPLSHFTPIGAMALFGGACFKQGWKAVLFPLSALLLSDLLIQFFVFNGRYGILYSGWYWIYGIFVLITLLGRLLVKKISIATVFAAAVSATLLHWAAADFTVWAGGGTDLRTGQPLSRNWQGLAQCYIQGWPFARNFLLGTLAYSGIMFGVFVWLQSRMPAVKTA